MTSRFPPRSSVVLLLLVACQPDQWSGEGCTDAEQPSVRVTLEGQDGATLEDPFVQYTVDDGSGVAPCEDQGDHWVCGWEEPGEFAVTGWADGWEPQTETVTVGQGECHVQTRDVTLVLSRECTDTSEEPSVVVTVTDADGAALTGATVEYLPLDGSMWTAPMSCDPHGAGAWACGWELAGEIEIWVDHAGYQGHYEVVVVGHDGCNVITETLDVVLER